MTAYVANHEKKKRIFAKREQEMLHALKHDLSLEKLLVAAEKLRAAKIGVFKCRFSKNSEKQPHSVSPEEMAAHNDEVKLWLEISVDDIVDLYRARVP